MIAGGRLPARRPGRIVVPSSTPPTRTTATEAHRQTPPEQAGPSCRPRRRHGRRRSRPWCRHVTVEGDCAEELPPACRSTSTTPPEGGLFAAAVTLPWPAAETHRRRARLSATTLDHRSPTTRAVDYDVVKSLVRERRSSLRGVADAPSRAEYCPLAHARRVAGEHLLFDAWMAQIASRRVPATAE